MKYREPLEDWEKTLHRELTEIPELEAPATLIPGVLSRIRAEERSTWYQSPWWEWPLALRAASALIVFALLGGFAWLSGSFGELGLGQRLVEGFSQIKNGAEAIVTSGVESFGASTGFWSQYGQMILLATAALIIATYLTCVAAGTALYQLAWRRTS